MNFLRLILLKSQSYVCVVCLTSSVDASGGQGAIEGGNRGWFLSLQLWDRFLFYWRWRGRFRKGGWEHVLAVLHTPKTHESSSVRTQRTPRVLRERKTNTLGPCVVWDLAWIEKALEIQTNCTGDLTKQTAIMNQLLEVWKDKLNNAQFNGAVNWYVILR